MKNKLIAVILAASVLAASATGCGREADRISVEKKLAQAKPVGTKFAVGKDLSTGEVEAEEYGPGIKGQMSFDDYQEENCPQGDRDTVVDFRNAK